MGGESFRIMKMLAELCLGSIAGIGAVMSSEPQKKINQESPYGHRGKAERWKKESDGTNRENILY